MSCDYIFSRVIRMKLVTTVTVVQILTEKSKEKIANSLSARKTQLQKEIGQLQFEMKRLEKSKKFPEYRLRQYFEKEIDERKEKIKLLDFQLEQLEILPLGSELKEREMEAIVEVQEGDSWEKILAGKTIVIKDGIIEEIREV